MFVKKHNNDRLYGITKYGIQNHNTKWSKMTLTPKDSWVFGCKTTQNYPF
jgi:hypothetical protein